MAFPLDSIGFSPLHVTLTTADGIVPDCDWNYPFTLYTDATTVAYDIGDWFDQGRVVFKEKPTDSDANAIATGTAYVEATDSGVGALFLARNSISTAWIGKRLYFTFKASNGAYWFPILYGEVPVLNAATFTED